MNQLLYVAATALAPGIELRGAIPLGIALGLDLLVLTLLSLAINLLLIPVLFFGLKISGFRKLVFWVLGRRVKKKIARHRRRFEAWDELALIPFVAVPLPGTGAYTGVLVAEFLGLNRVKSGLAIALGVAIAAALVLLASAGLFSL